VTAKTVPPARVPSFGSGLRRAPHLGLGLRRAPHQRRRRIKLASLCAAAAADLAAVPASSLAPVRRRAVTVPASSMAPVRRRAVMLRRQGRYHGARRRGCRGRGPPRPRPPGGPWAQKAPRSSQKLPARAPLHHPRPPMRGELPRPARPRGSALPMGRRTGAKACLRRAAAPTKGPPLSPRGGPARQHQAEVRRGPARRGLLGRRGSAAR